MTSPATLIAAREAGLILTVDPAGLRCRPTPSPELLACLRAHKAELLGLLTGTLCRRCGTHLDYQHDWSTRVFADGTGTCGPCYYFEAAERALRAPDALADEAEIMLRGKRP